MFEGLSRARQPVMFVCAVTVPGESPMTRNVQLASTMLVALLPATAFATGTPSKEEGPTYRTNGVDVRPATYKSEAACDDRMAQGKPCTIRGVVFNDLNRDGKRQRNEPGIPGVAVSNGLEVVKTNWRGVYRLPVRDQVGGTTIFVTKPSEYRLPVDEYNVPQFFYHHIPEGSPELRFGGLEPSGALPRRVNFPMIRGKYQHSFKIAVSGDTQPYSNNEIGYVRDTLARDIVAEGNDVEFIMVEGDVMGDDLGLFPRFKEVMSVTGAPLYMVGGNHDLDFDATDDAHSFDTLRREWGPTYYSFDIGKVHFVGLDDVKYPCMPDEDNADGLHSFCDDPDGSPTYNGRITPEQLEWLYNDLKHVDPSKLIVLNLHIPIISFVDMYATKHQVDNAVALYELLAGRKALALSGHTHTLEQFRPGEEYEGWNTAFSEPFGPTPFPQIITGAASGSWWSGDFTTDGIPNALQRLGAPRGYLVIEFEGNEYRDRYKATGQAAERQMSLSFLSPSFTDWYDTLLAWVNADPDTRSAITPVGINDLPDPSIITAADMAGGTYLVANVWNGSRDSGVWVEFDGGEPIFMSRTQDGNGEGVRPSLDPYALERQLYSLRYAIRSESGDPRAQGFELFGGARFEGEAQPLPTWMLTNRSTHLWTVPVPRDLGVGAHVARVTTVDHHGNESTEVIAFEVREERPFPFFRSEVFE
ncbi:MAG: phosphohydrolase [Myxococcales bacterium FL481]|nr:MAG: phosphohydrolase [Myxococcales bacterium FL481]